MVFGRAVQTSRENLGRQLAKESPVDADLVVPVPDSGVTAAVGYAAESGIPFASRLSVIIMSAAPSLSRVRVCAISELS